MSKAAGMSVAALHDLVACELAESVDPRVAEMAAAIAGRYPGAARAVMFYGSCLRERQLDGLMLDFYLIVSDYRAAYGKSWLAPANRLVPPNVFPFEHHGLVAKYAVLSEADFHRLNGPETLSVSVWARFAQPSGWCERGAEAATPTAAAVRAPPTLLAAARRCSGIDPLDCGASPSPYLFAELRSEARPAVLGRRGDPRVTPLHARRWPRRDYAGRRCRAERCAPRRRLGNGGAAGKALSVIRLAKASGTYAGGIDYLAWKINRHSGAGIEIKPWQRRWPLLAAFTLLPKLLRRGPFASPAPERAGDRAGQRRYCERLAQDLLAAQFIGVPASPT
jgi:hypothetical protein